MELTFCSTRSPYLLQCDKSTAVYGLAHERRSPNYKPNIWSYDFLQSLRSEFSDVVYGTCIVKLKDEFMHSWSDETELSSRLHIVDNISKLGCSNVFTKQMKEALDSIASDVNKTAGLKKDILKTALSFRLLRQHGYNVSENVFIDFVDEMVSFEERVGPNLRGVLELFEASHLAIEGEEVMVKAKDFSYRHLKGSQMFVDDNLAQHVVHSLKNPCHWRVPWFDVRHQIHAYEQENDDNKILLELAKLNFNTTQAMLIEELKGISRWWKNLGLIENINFSRDRIVESFLLTVGIAFEPQYALLRKCLTKVVTLVLVIDDLYDIYGSLEELKSFTQAVKRKRWDSQELQQLPECMKICFQTLRITIAEIAHDIEKEKDRDDISFFLKTAWADFCDALLSEAWWYNTSHIPSVEDYLRSAWITSSGPLLSLVTLLCSTDSGSGSPSDKLRQSRDLIYYISLIIRLCNDLGTSAAEFERGDSPSSILCYMVEANATEEMARDHVKMLIANVWKKINAELLSASPEQRPSMSLIVNIARVCQFIYRDGDGFSVPDKDTRKQIKCLLIEPIALSKG